MYLSQIFGIKSHKVVIWLLGISGAGKTTIGTQLAQKLQEDDSIKTFLIDGDIVRTLFNNDLGFSEEDRKANIKRIVLAAYVLEKADVIPIVCNISPFQKLRNLCRQKFDNYIEIYLSKDLSNAMKQDVKGVYRNNLQRTSLVGLDMKFDDPIYCDLKVEIDKETPEDSFKKVLGFIRGRIDGTEVQN
jgi:adenylylsulfate kinase-like enzyme